MPKGMELIGALASMLVGAAVASVTIVSLMSSSTDEPGSDPGNATNPEKPAYGVTSDQ